ncbi:hypothetical protein [Pedobacter sp.]
MITVSAQQIVGWNFSVRPYSKGNDTEIKANEADPNLEETILRRGAGLNNLKGFMNSFAAGFAKQPTSLEEARTTDTYMEFVVAPKSGYVASFKDLSFKVKCTNHGGVNYRWLYSKDKGKTFLSLGDNALAENSAEGIEQPKVELSVIGEINSKAKVIFRLYLWGATKAPSEGSNFAIGRYPLQSAIPSLAISGTVKPQ